jgi:hypothetical protein
MPLITLILLVFAFVLFVLAGCNVPSPRWNLIGWGLACWVLATILERGPVLLR